MPPRNVDRDELEMWVTAIRDDIKEGFRGTWERQDHTNGRLRKAERDIAVLNDRADQAAKVVAGATTKGAGIGAALIALVELVKVAWSAFHGA